VKFLCNFLTLAVAFFYNNRYHFIHNNNIRYIEFIIMNELLLTPFEVSQTLARSAREKRLSLNLSQQSLSKASGVSYSVIKKFELTGKISLESLLKLAAALGNLSDFTEIFTQTTFSARNTFDELMKSGSSTRKRGRK
jgi:hypothetical protein